MRFSKIKIWHLMVLVAGVALAIPWWRWHVEMLKRSDDYWKRAIEAERFVRICESDLQEYRRWEVIEKARNLGDHLKTTQLLIEHSERSIAGYKPYAAACRRAVTLPWLDAKEPPFVP